MATITAPPRAGETVADLLKRLGDMPPGRVRLHPAPGTATEDDVLAVRDREGRLCELVEGVLVEKPIGLGESEIAALLITFLNNFIRRRRLGIVTAPDGALRLRLGLVRMPDLSFISWGRLPGRRRPKKPIPDLAPDPAIEVLSRSNSRAEIARKLREYFSAGTRLAWVVDPRKKTVRVHTSPERSVLLKEGDALDGGDVLPGFRLAVREALLPPVEPE